MNHIAAIGLVNVAENAVEDLETASAIMVQLGNHIPSEDVQPDWFAWFGRQIEVTSERLKAAVKGAR